MTDRLSAGLRIFLNGLVLNAFFCVISFYTVKYSDVWYLPLGIAMCVLISYIGELSVKNTKSNFIALLLCAVVGLLSLGSVLLSFSYVNGILFAVSVFIWLLLYRFNKSFFEIPFPHKSFILLFIFAYFTGVCFDIGVMKVFMCVEGIIFLLINTFMEGLFVHEKFIKENQSVQNFPKEQIRKTYLSLLFVFVCICLIVVILVTSIKIPGQALSDWISDALHNMYELLPEFDARVGVASPDVGMGGGNPYEEALIVFGIERKQYIWLERISNIVSLTVTAAVIGFALYYFMRRIFNGLKQTKQIGSDTMEFVYDKDFITKVIKAGKEKNTGEENEKKIRKIYKKYVLKKTGKDIKKGDTPQIIQNKISGDLKKSEAVRTVYEKARYSGQKCELQDVENIKRNIK